VAGSGVVGLSVVWPGFGNMVVGKRGGKEKFERGKTGKGRILSVSRAGWRRWLLGSGLADYGG